MTREEKIDFLQNQARHYRINKEELGKECDENDIDLYDEVLFPIGFNTCDRCGNYGWSEQDFLWVDDYPWDENNPNDQNILKNIEREGVDYCSICWECVNKLKRSRV